MNLDEALGRDSKGFTDSTISRIKNAGEPLVKYMLFCEEAQLAEPLHGDTAFAAEFAKRGPCDKMLAEHNPGEPRCGGGSRLPLEARKRSLRRGPFSFFQRAVLRTRSWH